MSRCPGSGVKTQGAYAVMKRDRSGNPVFCTLCQECLHVVPIVPGHDLIAVEHMQSGRVVKRDNPAQDDE